jgi:single-stranded DNA-binding protein
MSLINKAIISCYLVGDPDLRQIAADFNVCRVRVRTSVRRKNRQSQAWQDQPVWMTVEIYGNDADYIARYAHKKSWVAFEGELEYNESSGNDGQKKSELRLVVDRRNGGEVDLGPPSSLRRG